VGNILTWRQQADATAVLWRYAYDAADQLLAARKESTDPTPLTLERFAYAYDPAGNRTVEQIGDVITVTSHDALNRLQTQVMAGRCEPEDCARSGIDLHPLRYAARIRWCVPHPLRASVHNPLLSHAPTRAVEEIAR
jgi:hypothetical protein